MDVDDDFDEDEEPDSKDDEPPETPGESHGATSSTTDDEFDSLFNGTPVLQKLKRRRAIELRELSHGEQMTLAKARSVLPQLQRKFQNLRQTNEDDTPNIEYRRVEAAYDDTLATIVFYERKASKRLPVGETLVSFLAKRELERLTKYANPEDYAVDQDPRIPAGRRVGWHSRIVSAAPNLTTAQLAMGHQPHTSTTTTTSDTSSLFTDLPATVALRDTPSLPSGRPLTGHNPLGQPPPPAGAQPLPNPQSLSVGTSTVPSGNPSGQPPPPLLLPRVE